MRGNGIIYASSYASEKMRATIEDVSFVAGANRISFEYQYKTLITCCFYFAALRSGPKLYSATNSRGFDAEKSGKLRLCFRVDSLCAQLLQLRIVMFTLLDILVPGRVSAHGALHASLFGIFRKRRVVRQFKKPLT